MALKGNGRREFLLKSGAALAATSVSWSASSYASILGANDRVRVGVVGCGDRMRDSLDPGVSGECTKDSTSNWSRFPISGIGGAKKVPLIFKS